MSTPDAASGTPALSLDEVSTLISTILAGIRTGEPVEDRLFSLKEVAERTGFSLKGLMNDCQRDLIWHTHRGRTRGMTSSQIAELLRRHARGGDLADRFVDDDLDPLEQARRASLKNARRATSYRRRKP